MSLRKMIEIQKKYFQEYGQEIALRNLKLMITVCYAGIAIFAVYYIITFLFFPAEAISAIYALIIPVLILFLIRIKYSLKKGAVCFWESQRMTVLIYAVVMIYSIIMSVVPHPDLQAVYYPLFLLLGPVMFILRPYQQLLINGISYLFFYYCVIQIKPEICWKHDLFEGFTALIFSMVMILLMTQFRVQSDGLKDVYYQLSRLDGLTGLMNKVTGEESAARYVEDKIRQEPFALIMLDVDEFKKINDNYGHEKGDVLLKCVGSILKNTFRRDDVVCRFGGDEFMVLLKNITKENTEQKIKEFTGKVERLSAEQNMAVTCSIGICTGNCGERSIHEVLVHADEALYCVKRNGKNHYRYYEKEV